MSERLENKKIILVVMDDPVRRQDFEVAVLRHLPGATIYQAADGSEAWVKMENVPPHVVVLERELAKTDGLALVQAGMEDRRFDQTSFVFIDPPPETEVFVDEIVTGRIQFLGREATDARLARSLARALNDVASREKTSFKLRFLAAGDQLFKKGDPGDNVYLLKRGRMEARTGGDDESVFLWSIETGEFVGEMAYINGQPRSADVFALEDCELIEIPFDHLDHVLYQKPSWSRALMRTLSKRLQRANAALTEDDPASSS